MQVSRRDRGDRRRRGWAASVSAIAHLAVGLLILAQRPAAVPLAPDLPPMQVFLAEPPPRAAPASAPGAEAGDAAGGAVQGPPAAAAPTRPDPAPRPPAPPLAPTPPRHRPPTVRPAPDPAPPVATAGAAEAVPAEAPVRWIGLGDAELSGAMTAGGGSGSGSGSGAGSGGSGGGAGGGTGGGDCDMLGRLQRALGRDARIRAAVAQAQTAPGMAGKAVLVWDGAWVQTPGQAGRGLAGVRQAIAVEVAFAPAACRAESLRGLALLSLGEGASAPRVVLGTARWRWSDLLEARR